MLTYYREKHVSGARACLWRWDRPAPDIVCHRLALSSLARELTNIIGGCGVGAALGRGAGPSTRLKLVPASCTTPPGSIDSSGVTKLVLAMRGGAFVRRWARPLGQSRNHGWENGVELGHWASISSG